MDNDASIRRLIGPDHRDEAIEFQTVSLDEQLIVHVVAGEEALYYLWLIPAPAVLERMEGLIERGQEERMSRGLKGFELVLVCPQPEALELEVRRMEKASGIIQPETTLRLARAQADDD